MPGMETMSDVLAPWKDIPSGQDADPLPTRSGYWQFVDVPPDVAASALALADPSSATGRGNGQPPAQWLVEQTTLHHGRLCGSLDSHTGFLRFDTICVDREAADGLLRAVEVAWPADGHHPKSTLELAAGLIWSNWDATDPTWEGPAVRLLESPPLGGS